jgi:hypothetical protein
MLPNPANSQMKLPVKFARRMPELNLTFASAAISYVEELFPSFITLKQAFYMSLSGKFNC